MQLIEQIPTVGLYIFESLIDNGEYRSSNLTKHCVLDSPHMFDHREEGKTPCEWILNAIDGRVERIGLGYL